MDQACRAAEAPTCSPISQRAGRGRIGAQTWHDSIGSVNEARRADEARGVAGQRIDSERTLQHVFDVAACMRDAVERLPKLSGVGGFYDVRRDDDDDFGLVVQVVL